MPIQTIPRISKIYLAEACHKSKIREEGNLEAFRTEAICKSPKQTQKIGETIGNLAQPGQTFLLVGDLGAGKTCLTQGIARGLGAKENARSPTFVLVAEYQGRLKIYHMDLYRIETMEEILDLDIDEYFHEDAIFVVEWADKALSMFPKDHLDIRIKYLDENTRHLTLTTKSEKYTEILNTISPDLSEI